MLDQLREQAPWLAPVLVFGLVVFVHELGHFLAAKAVGVYAPRFSIGFGPALFRRRYGETEYRIGALPLGGYVRMASRDDEATAFMEGGSEEASASTARTGDPNAMMPFGPKPIPPDRWFESKPLLARLAIMLAGVTMNALLTLVIVTGVLVYYGRPSVYSPPVVESVAPGSPAAQAGLAAGDSVVAVNGTPVKMWSDVVTRIRPSAGQALTLRVAHAGKVRDISLTPRATPDTNPETHVITEIGRIGAAFRPQRQPVPLGEAISAGWTETREMSGLIVGALRDLATGRASLRTLQGPVRIAQFSVAAARSGFEQLLLLVALLSINVAVFNLLPIPILDGGQIVLTVLESIKGRPFSMQTREYVLRAGLLAIALLFALVMYNDRCVVSSAFC